MSGVYSGFNTTVSEGQDYSKLENGVWSKPTNLGPKFNSVNDDTHFRYYPDLKIATWASMADKDGFFSYDLFQADLKSLNLEFQK